MSWTLTSVFVTAIITLASLRGSSAEASQPVNTEEVQEEDRKWMVRRKRMPTVEWTVDDVAHWMNYTIGYAEYTRYIEKHRVDGPTLLHMTPDDFETYFPIANAIHLIKLRAHLDILRGKCLCPSEASQEAEFWSLLRSENNRMWVLGLTSLPFPRVAMFYSYFFDKEVYQRLLGGELTISEEEDGEASGASTRTHFAVSWLSEIVFWICGLLIPDSFMAYQCLRLVASNYVVMPLFVIHFLLQQYNEVQLVYLMWQGTAFEPGTTWKARIWDLYRWFFFLPLGAWITSYFIPLLLQQLAVFALMGHVVLVLVGLAMYLIGHRPDAPPTAADDHNDPKKE